MRTVIRLGVTVSLLAAGSVGALVRAADASVEIRPDVPIYGATAEQIDLGRWAVRRCSDTDSTEEIGPHPGGLRRLVGGSRGSPGPDSPLLMAIWRRRPSDTDLRAETQEAPRVKSLPGPLSAVACSLARDIVT